jgi:hypothetical protein
MDLRSLPRSARRSDHRWSNRLSPRRTTCEDSGRLPPVEACREGHLPRPNRRSRAPEERRCRRPEPRATRDRITGRDPEHSVASDPHAAPSTWLPPRVARCARLRRERRVHAAEPMFGERRLSASEGGSVGDHAGVEQLEEWREEVVAVDACGVREAVGCWSSAPAARMMPASVTAGRRTVIPERSATSSTKAATSSRCLRR